MREMWSEERLFAGRTAGKGALGEATSDPGDAMVAQQRVVPWRAGNRMGGNARGGAGVKVQAARHGLALLSGQTGSVLRI
jgi:hypothetical protein